MLSKFLLKYKGDIIYLLASYTTPIVTMISGAIAAAFIGPNILGKINSLNLITAYMAFLHLGVFNALNRNLSLFKAQNDTEKVQKMVNASYQMAKYNSYIGLLVGITILLYFLITSDIVYILSSIFLLFNLVLNPFTLHFDTTYRSSQQFKILGKIILKENIIFTIISFSPIFFNYLGKILSSIIRVVIRYFLRFQNQPYTANERGKKKDIVDLIKVGFPLLIGSYLFTVFSITDQSIIVKYLGAKKLGLYSLSSMLISIFTLIPSSLAVLFYPRASAKYGTTKSNRGLRIFFWKALLINFLVIVPLCTLIFLTIEPITIAFFPKYIDGITASKYNLLTCMTFLAYGPSVLLGVTRRNTPLLLAYSIGIVLMWLFAFSLPAQFLSIELVALLRFFVSLGVSITILIYAYFLTSRDEFIR